MKRHSLFNTLNLSVATIALFVTPGSNALATLPTTIPTSCNFIWPNGFNCCWVFPDPANPSATPMATLQPTECHDLWPDFTPFPSLTPTPYPESTPGSTPAPSTTPTPTPMPSTCPTDIYQTLSNANAGTFTWTGLTIDIAGAAGGILTFPTGTGGMECGHDANGHAIPCYNNQVGQITKNCLLAGYDPPPFLRPDVMLNLDWSLNSLMPWVKAPNVGSTEMFQGAGNNVIAANCTPPYVAGSGFVISESDTTNHAPNRCQGERLSNAPTNSWTEPAPTQCPPITTAFPGCAPPGFTPDPAPANCNDTQQVPNLPTSQCDTTTVSMSSSSSASYVYCHTNISTVPQACPNTTTSAPPCPTVPAPGTFAIPGFRCGGAIPLLDPIPMDPPLDTTLLPSCPPDNWCINNATSGLFRDGNIHINYQAPPGVYNITLAMGQNNMSAASSMRIATIPAMGACAALGGTTQVNAAIGATISTNIAAHTGTLVLSQGYAYAVLPSSIIETVNGGTFCQGESCNYTPPTTSWSAAPWDIDYSTPYQPYGAFKTSTPDYYGNPGMWVPYIDLPPGTEVLFSIQVHGSIQLPKGGSIVTSTGGLITVPNQGMITAVGDGSTVLLSPGTGYLLDAGVGGYSIPTATSPYPVAVAQNGSAMHIASGTCFVQLVPPSNGTDPQVTVCQSNQPPPFPPANTIPNASVLINTSAIAVMEDTPLPPFTNLYETGICGETQMTGSTIEPDFCTPPLVFSQSSNTCVTAQPTCPGGTLGGTPLTCTIVDPVACTTTVGPPICEPVDLVWCQSSNSCVQDFGGTTLSACGGVMGALVTNTCPGGGGGGGGGGGP